MLYQYARKLLSGYSLLISLSVLVIAGYTAIRYFGFLAPPLCDARPAYNTEVPAEVRARIDFLFDSGLLYCGQLRGDTADLATVNPTIYWGSDGSRSTVFFQALPGSTLAGVGLTEYVLGSDSTPTAIGDARPAGFFLDAVGRPAWVNQADTPDATWYFREDGPPGPGDVAVRLRVVGPARERASLVGRNFEQDFWRMWGAVRGQTAGGVDANGVAAFPILHERWAKLVQRGEINPALADERGQTNPTLLATAALPGPTLLNTVAGTSASTVWVAGVISGTQPAMVLVPPAGAARGAIEPIGQAQWASDLGPNRLAHFAFEPQPLDTALEARYWNDGRRKDSAPPDYTWPVVFASRPPDVTPSDANPPGATPSAAP